MNSIWIVSQISQDRRECTRHDFFSPTKGLGHSFWGFFGCFMDCSSCLPTFWLAFDCPPSSTCPWQSLVKCPPCLAFCEQEVMAAVMAVGSTVFPQRRRGAFVCTSQVITSAFASCLLWKPTAIEWNKLKTWLSWLDCDCCLLFLAVFEFWCKAVITTTVQKPLPGPDREVESGICVYLCNLDMLGSTSTIDPGWGCSRGFDHDCPLYRSCPSMSIGMKSCGQFESLEPRSSNLLPVVRRISSLDVTWGAGWLVYRARPAVARVAVFRSML